MKKRLFVMLLFFISFLFLTGCSILKKVITVDEFSQIAERDGLSIADVKEQFSDYDEIISATIAVNQDGWQVEHYILATKDDAKRMFAKNKAFFESNSVSGSKTTNIEYFNHTKYSLETGSLYMVISRIDNSLVYASIPIAYKSEAVQFIKDIGY